MPESADMRLAAILGLSGSVIGFALGWAVRSGRDFAVRTVRKGRVWQRGEDYFIDEAVLEQLLRMSDRWESGDGSYALTFGSSRLTLRRRPGMRLSPEQVGEVYQADRRALKKPRVWTDLIEQLVRAGLAAPGGDWEF